MSLPNYEKYRALIDHPTLTDKEKDDLIAAWWTVVNRIVDAIYDGSLPVSPPETTNKKQKNTPKKRLGKSKKKKLPD